MITCPSTGWENPCASETFSMYNLQKAFTAMMKYYYTCNTLLAVFPRKPILRYSTHALLYIVHGLHWSYLFLTDGLWSAFLFPASYSGTSVSCHDLKTWFNDLSGRGNILKNSELYVFPNKTWDSVRRCWGWRCTSAKKKWRCGGDGDGVREGTRIKEKLRKRANSWNIENGVGVQE